MITDRIARLPAFVAARAVDAGLLPGSRDYTRFVVLGWYRTGSNLLLSLLNSDPAVVAYSEVFSPRGLFWGSRAYAPTGDALALAAVRQTQPARFLADAVFRPHPRRVQAVGFKLFYPQIDDRPLPGLAEALLEDEGLRIVHLQRANLLRVLVSNVVARRTGQMSATSRAEADLALLKVLPLRLDPRKCVGYMRRLERRVRENDARFPRDRVLQVVYEDLDRDRDTQHARVRAFLGLPPATATTRLVRQTRRPLADLVENLDEVRAALEGTPWAELCDS